MNEQDVLEKETSIRQITTVCSLSLRDIIVISYPQNFNDVMCAFAEKREDGRTLCMSDENLLYCGYGYSSWGKHG